ncbi:MAG: hypothetical protein Q8O62_04405 [Aequorivita sp.]|nr:hypothetical protein [Aequorivita sp.]
MAITFHKEPSGIYPAYNDCYLQFSSDLTENNKAVISLIGVSESIYTLKDYTIYPDLTGKYLFNVKAIMKALFSIYGFNDQYSEIPTDYVTNGFGESISGGYRVQVFKVAVHNDSTSEFVNKTYSFFKSAKQIGEPVYTNPYQILNRSTNGVDFNLTYFEGYPFAFDLQRVPSGSDIRIKNLNTNITADSIEASSTNAYRVYVDTGTYNWTTTDFLPLTDTINRLEIYNTTDSLIPKTNLNLKKIPSKCGVYLKWFNLDGGYSYWLFDQFTTNTLSARDYSTIATNEFFNINEGFVAPTTLIGKSGKVTMKLNTQVDRNEGINLQSLFTSPSVQMWSSQEPFNDGNWVNVLVSDKYELLNKKDINKISITIDLPELITPTL